MNDSTDDELRSRFEQLRAADAGSAPDFHGLFDRANHLPAVTHWNMWQWPRRVAIPVALAAAIVAAAGIVRVSRRPAFVAPPLSAWTSPTAALLRTPTLGPLAPPQIFTSMLDRALPQPAFRRGTKR